MDRITCLACLGHVNQATEFFWPERAMDKPLWIPGRFQGTQCEFAEHRQKMGSSKGRERRLLLQFEIRISGIWRSSCLIQSQRRVVESLANLIEMHVSGQVTAVSIVSGLRINWIRRERPSAI